MDDMVDQEMRPHAERLPSRRAFMEAAAAVAALSVMPPFRGDAAPAQAARSAVRPVPVVGFHMDRPYLDPTGTAEPYYPPAGTRSGQPLAELSEQEFRSRHVYL